jgi:glycosyltransferase involved in cell wall biosynthesis
MRILLASKHPHFPQAGGGLERNTHELCLRLVRQGVQPAVMCNLRADGSAVALANRLRRKLTPRIRFPVDRRLGYPVYRGWAEEDGAQEVLRRFRPDVVIAQSAEPAALLQSFGPGSPRMAYFHEVEHLDELEAIARMPGVGLLANSAFTASRIAQRTGAEPDVIVPLIDRAFYQAPRRPSRVLFVNTRPRKGLEIAFRLAESRPDAPFDFVKSWILTPSETAEMARRAAAAGNITLHAPTNDMRPLYSRARLLLAPSQWEETWGRVATEAQINGIPVLASDRGGLPEAVGPGGVLVPHDAPLERWAAAFSTLWDDPARYAQFAARAIDYSNRPDIDPETIVAKFIEVVGRFVAAAPAAVTP